MSFPGQEGLVLRGHGQDLRVLFAGRLHGGAQHHLQVALLRRAAHRDAGRGRKISICFIDEFILIHLFI